MRISTLFSFSTLLVFALLGTFELSAQDIHFDQYYTHASSYNPALVANYDGSYRLSAIYRNQWGSSLGSSAYKTMGADADVSLLEGYLKHDKLGIGVGVYNDVSGAAGLSVLNASLSVAYHKGFGMYGMHRLSLGAQGAFIQKRVDNPTFGDQFQGHDQTPLSTTIEQYKRGINNFDFNAGAYWRSNFHDKVKLNLGFAVYHLVQPKEANVLGSLSGAVQKDYVLNRRYNADASVEVFFKKKFSVSPEIAYFRAGQSQEILPGLFFAYYFNTGFRKNTSLHLGARYRVVDAGNGRQDAADILFQVEFRNFRAGFAYDVNVSPLSQTTKHQGGYEISLTYIGESIKSFKANKSLPSRRF